MGSAGGRGRDAHARAGTDAHARAHVQMRTRTHAQMHTRTGAARMHTHTRMHTHARTNAHAHTHGGHGVYFIVCSICFVHVVSCHQREIKAHCWLGFHMKPQLINTSLI